MTTTRELIDHYVGLLIIQYIGNASNQAAISTQSTPVVMPQTTVEVITFSATPTSGQWVLRYDTESTAPLDWNDTAADVQTALRALTGLSLVTVTGAITAAAGLTVTFVGVTPPALGLELASNTLTASAVPVVPAIVETDLTIPLAVQAGFDLLGENTAVGVQLDWIGKYVGVVRTALGLSSNITLDDADFATLIKIATIKNNAGSSMYDIVGLLYQFFPGQILVFDNLDMSMTYYVSTTLGSNDLLEMVIVQGLLPRPMAVLINTIVIGPTIDAFFGFRTYAMPLPGNTPFNKYADGFTPNWFWLSYSNAFPT